MATRFPTTNRNITKDNSVIAVTWTGLLNADVGDPVSYASFGDKTFQVTGTFGAAGNVLIEGSNDGVTYTALSNRQGTAMNFTAAGLNTSQDKPVFVRPRVTAGDGTTSLAVIVCCHRSDISEPG